jgi:hypothetical protein
MRERLSSLLMQVSLVAISGKCPEDCCVVDVARQHRLSRFTVLFPNALSVFIATE